VQLANPWDLDAAQMPGPVRLLLRAENWVSASAIRKPTRLLAHELGQPRLLGVALGLPDRALGRPAREEAPSRSESQSLPNGEGGASSTREP